MKSPFDQTPEQEAEQQYERNLARNYPPDERAGIRASDQRAAYQAATLKLNAAKEAQNVMDTSIRLGIAQAGEARAIKADALANAKNAAENAFLERDRELEQESAGQVPAMLEEIKKRRNPNGYVSFQDLNEIDIMFPLASLSKNPRIARMKDQERELTTSVMGKQAESRENFAKEERARNKETEERMIAEVAAQEAGAVPTKFIIGGKTFETSTKADAATLQAAYKMASDNFEKAFDNRRSAQDKMDKLREEINLRDNKNPTADQAERMNSFKELIKVADKELDRQTARRDAAEADWDENRGRKKPTKTEQPQATAGNPSGTSAGGAPAATDRKARAQQALDDPESTGAERAAARRILGQ